MVKRLIKRAANKIAGLIQRGPKFLRTKRAANKQDLESLEVAQNRENHELEKNMIMQAPRTYTDTGIRTGRQLSKKADKWEPRREGAVRRRWRPIGQGVSDRSFLNLRHDSSRSDSEV